MCSGAFVCDDVVSNDRVQCFFEWCARWRMKCRVVCDGVQCSVCYLRWVIVEQRIVRIRRVRMMCDYDLSRVNLQVRCGCVEAVCGLGTMCVRRSS